MRKKTRCRPRLGWHRLLFEPRLRGPKSPTSRGLVFLGGSNQLRTYIGIGTLNGGTSADQADEVWVSHFIRRLEAGASNRCQPAIILYTLTT